MAEKIKETGAKERKGNAPKQTMIPGTERTEETIGDIPLSKFKKLELAIKNGTQKKDDGQMSLASAAKEFKDAGGHYECLKLVFKLDRMADDKLHEWLRNFDAYVDYLGVRRRTGDLFKDDAVAKAQDAKPLDALKAKEETKEDQGAYESGIAACKFDKPRASNPHPKDSSMYDAFDRGWVKARELDQKGTMNEGGGDAAKSETVVAISSAKTGASAAAGSKG